MTKKENTLLISIGVLVLLLYGLAGLFCHPSLDDFIYAWKGRQDDFINTVLHERETWNGRYFSNFIVHFSPLNWGGILAYKLMPALLIAFTFFGTQVFFKNILQKKSYTLSLVCVLITFSVLPDITEGIYWFTGAYTYIPSGVLFLIILSFVFKLRSSIKVKHLLLPIFLVLIACGFNEIIPILGIAIFTFALILEKKKKLHLLFLLGLFVALLYYIISAPGNDIRASYFPNKHQLFYSLFKSSLYTVRFIGEWVINPVFIFWSFLLIKLKIPNQTINKLSFLRDPITILFALILPTYLCCFGPMWSTGLLGQHRTANLACFFFVPTFTLIIIANKDYLLNKLAFANHFKYHLICLLICLCFWGNQFTLINEFIGGELAAFNQQMYSRYEQIKQCEKNDCIIPEIKTQSELLFVYPLVENPENFHNSSYQLYFKSGKIFLK
ncbi:MAG: hypothetical protein ACJ0QL_01010 [Parvicellaceae bacterium]